MKYKPSRDIPRFAREHKTVSASTLARIILSKRNKDVKPHSITVWFDRHPLTKGAILKGIHDQELPQVEVNATIFQNGTFEQLDTVKEWLEQMQDRKLDPTTISGRIAALKQVCRGQGLKDYTFKHPDRLTLDETRDYIRQKKASHHIHIALRDFLLSKGIVVGKKISGATVKGKYRKLYVPPAVCREFLEGVKALNFQCYAVDLFEVKNATRVSAVLNALIENINEEEGYITVFDKGRRSIYPEGHDWDKHLDPELKAALKRVIGNRVEGLIFSIDVDDVRKINKSVLNDLIKKHADNLKVVRLLKMCLNIPTHWLRHEFFQHCLHKTDWKYGVCAALGGSTVSSLEESYGAPPKAIVKKWGEEWLDKITV